MKNKIKPLLIGLLISAGMFSPALAEDYSIYQVLYRPDLQTTTLEYADGHGVVFDLEKGLGYNINIPDNVYLSAYKLTSTEETGANIITKSIFDATTMQVESTNYAITLNPDITNLTGSKSLTINGVNGGNFTINYNVTGTKENNSAAATIPLLEGNYFGLSNSNGGALYNAYSTATGKTVLGYYQNINANFIANSSTTYGGAIYNNNGRFNLLKGSFVGNSASGAYGGGAIYTMGGTLNVIIADFIGNKATSGYGGAISSNQGTFNYISGDFIGNTSKLEGGAIFNYKKKIGNILGDFIGNKSNSGYGGGAIYNTSGATIDNIYGNFIDNNCATGGGGAILNYSATIGNIEGSFVNNSRYAIKNYVGGTINHINADFINN